MKNANIKNILAILTTLIVLFVYWITLAPGVDFIDSGELSAVASTLGIAHPTGYPLFTIIGYLFAKLNFGISVILKLNFLNAVYSVAAIFIFYNFLTIFLKNIFNDKKESLQSICIISSVTALILAFSKTYWSTSTSFEVYSLHILFIALILYLTLKISLPNILNLEKIEISHQHFVLLMFVVGLSFTNHMTTILFLPALTYFIYWILKSMQDKKKILFFLSGVFAFILGLSVYLYLPIRAAHQPVFNWGNPVDLEKLLWHIGGKQYRVWIFSSTESALRQFKYYLTNFNNEFNYFFVLIGLIGLYSLYKKNKFYFIFTLLLFLVCVGYSINYDIHDIDSYFLLSYFVFALWIAIGLYTFVNYIEKKIKVIGKLVFILPLIPLYLNFRDCDESKNFLVEDYTINVFNSVEENSIIISYQWDNFVSASYYFQEVEKVRKDVIIIDKELLRRSWYFEQIKNNHPEIYNNSKVEIEIFLEELYKFEHNIPYNVQIIEKRYSDVIRSFIERNYNEKKIYVTPEIENQYLVGYKKIPSGLCYRILKEGDEVVPRYVDFKYRDIKKKEDRLIESMKNLYLRASLENGIFMMKLKDLDKAKNYFKKGLEINPNSYELRFYLNSIEQKRQ